MDGLSDPLVSLVARLSRVPHSSPAFFRAIAIYLVEMRAVIVLHKVPRSSLRSPPAVSLSLSFYWLDNNFLIWCFNRFDRYHNCCVDVHSSSGRIVCFFSPATRWKRKRPSNTINIHSTPVQNWLIKELNVYPI